jgi:hypothetical protein
MRQQSFSNLKMRLTFANEMPLTIATEMEHGQAVTAANSVSELEQTDIARKTSVEQLSE